MLLMRRTWLIAVVFARLVCTGTRSSLVSGRGLCSDFVSIAVVFVCSFCRICVHLGDRIPVLRETRATDFLLLRSNGDGMVSGCRLGRFSGQQTCPGSRLPRLPKPPQLSILTPPGGWAMVVYVVLSISCHYLVCAAGQSVRTCRQVQGFLRIVGSRSSLEVGKPANTVSTFPIAVEF